MIVLDFSAANFRRPGQALDDLYLTAFKSVPVLLKLAGIDLVSAEADHDGATVSEGLRLPLPEVAIWGLVALHHVKRAGESAYELNEHSSALLFRLNGDALLVHSDRREMTVQVPHDRLLGVWEDFDRRVRDFLRQTFGDLNQYSWWNPFLERWLQGELDYSTLEPPWASLSYLEHCDGCFDHIDAVET